MRFIRSRLELRMELHTHMETVGRNLDCLDKGAVRRCSADSKPRFLKPASIFVIVLEPMSVPLRNLRRSIAPFQHGPGQYPARICAEPHGSALSLDCHLLFHEVDDTVAAVFGEFPAVGVMKPKNISCIFDDADLHAEADAQIRYIVLSRISAGSNHSLDSAVAETARNQNSVYASQHFIDIFIGNLLRVDPQNFHISVICIAAVIQCFTHREI